MPNHKPPSQAALRLATILLGDSSAALEHSARRIDDLTRHRVLAERSRCAMVFSRAAADHEDNDWRRRDLEDILRKIENP